MYSKIHLELDRNFRALFIHLIVSQFGFKQVSSFDPFLKIVTNQFTVFSVGCFYNLENAVSYLKFAETFWHSCYSQHIYKTIGL